MDEPLEPVPIHSPHAVSTDADLEAIHACKILLIDDEQPNVRLLERILSRAGFENFISTTDSREAAALFADFQPDLVLTDWIMPHVDGCAVIAQLRALMATDDFLPIVVLTADITAQAKKRALSAGATDFLTKPFDPIEVLLRIQNLLKARLSHLIIQRQNATLEESVRLRTIELENALTELRCTQKQVIQQERLAALGTMAGGVAHDFNNSLSVIMGFGELLLRASKDGLSNEEALLSITTILTAAEDAAKIVRRLRTFHHPDEREEERAPIDLNELIEQAMSFTRPRWQTEATAAGQTITLTALPGEIPCIFGDAAELREVLTNLIFNAVDAMPQGGAINLGTRREGDSVALEITDTGTGMTEEVRQRCLEPFFSTKGAHGTGLGLSMVFGIIQRHGGTLGIESELGKGTTFTIRLPASNEDSTSWPEPLPWSHRPLHILVVDDQPILCQLLCEYLQADCHTVETALSGKEALEKIHDGNFDLIITDHVMAGMTGKELAAAIKRFNPTIPVILLTGYGGGDAASKQNSPACDLVLAKPLSRAALRHAFANVMPQQ